MRLSLLLFLAASAGVCQDFKTGQAARLVIGQGTFTAQSPGPTSESVLGGASGIAIAGNRLFVADASRVGAGPDNNRVLIYDNLSGLVPALTQPFVQGGRCPACLGPASVVIGQPDFSKKDIARTQSGMRLPTAVASDGVMVAVADTDNNRVLIWRSIPTTNGQPADVVIGQTDFTSLKPVVTDQQSLRGPQGVWFQNGKLFIADSYNHRVLIYNQVPTQNNAPADLILGQPSFATAPDPIVRIDDVVGARDRLLNPVSVTSDGTRLFVSDLGYNRVLIWNSIPTQNQQAADVVLGQPDFLAARANNAERVCEPNGANEDGTPTYPQRCAATLSFPRFAISDGRRLFVADGGNDRILIWNQIPTQNGQKADTVLGQLDEFLNNTSDSAFGDLVSAVDVLRTPMSLAVNENDLYVSDTFNRRIVIFTPANPKIPYTGVRNSASFDTYALGSVNIDVNSEIQKDDEITLKIEDKEYKYKIVEDDSFGNIINQLADLINAEPGDPNVVATPNLPFNQLVLTARAAGPEGDQIEYSITITPDTAKVVATTGGATLDGGQDAKRLAGGTIVTIVGDGLTDVTESAPPDASPLPNELGGVEVFFDGIRSPLMAVSPTRITAQLPWEVADTKSVSATIHTKRSDGTVDVSTAVGVPVVPKNPGIYALDGLDPRPAIMTHGSSYPTATVSVDGGVTQDNPDTTEDEFKEQTVTIIIGGDRKYSYTTKKGDDVVHVRIGLIEAINNGNDPQVTAYSAGFANRIRLQGRIPGPQLNGVKIGIELSEGATIILSPFNEGLCCANVEGAPVTAENPAIPGETIIVYATGLGKILPQEAQDLVRTGQKYEGPVENEPVEFVNSIAGGKTANVLFARLKPGMIGMYEVILELNSELPTNPETQLHIAQSFEVSNIVKFPLKNPKDQPEP